MLQGHMAFVRVSSLAKLPSGTTMEVEAAGLTIALCNVDGSIHAIGGICPHQGGPLGHGAMHGEHIVCPWHAWEFSCITGRNDFSPDVGVATYPVRLDGDDILVDTGA